MDQQEGAEARGQPGAPPMSAMPRLVAMVLSQGCQPRASGRPAGDAARRTDRRVRSRTSPADAGRAGTGAGPNATARDIRHGKRIHVANAAPVEIAGGGVVDRMDATPEVVRRQG